VSELAPERVEATIAALDRGEIRVAERVDGEWRVNDEAQRAILAYFRLRQMEPREVGPFEYHDMIPLKRGYEELGVRVVPPATARYGAFLSPGVVLMPSYVNIGAWVGPNTMVDTWATVGSGAQIGADVHLAGGVGIGGVLEPPGARPVIVEDGAFIGSRAAIVEGVVVGERAVIGPHVTLGASIPVIDVTGSEPVEHRGYVPPRAVVVPGTRPKEFPAGTFQLACALIIGWRSESTDLRVSLNEALREHGLGATDERRAAAGDPDEQLASREGNHDLAFAVRRGRDGDGARPGGARLTDAALPDTRPHAPRRLDVRHLDVRPLREARMPLEQRPHTLNLGWVAADDGVRVADRDRDELDAVDRLRLPHLDCPQVLLDDAVADAGPDHA
jgi:2,3,4,5-tetrahydropyridine-2-carboxylate N-succinyltransferase